MEQFAQKDNGGIEFMCPKPGRIDAQDMVIRKEIQYDTFAPMSEFNEPSFYVAPWCKNTIIAMTNHRHEEDSEREEEKYKDFSDAVTILYAGMEGWKYAIPVPEREREQNTEPKNEDGAYVEVSGADAFF